MGTGIVSSRFGYVDMTTLNEIRSHCSVLFLMAVLCASCKLITSSFAEIAFKSSTSGSITFSPRSVLTGVSSTSDMEINISESGTDVFAILVTSESPYLGWDYSDPETAVLGVAFHSFEWLFVRCESPFDFLIVFKFSLSIRDILLFSVDSLPESLCEDFCQMCINL